MDGEVTVNALGDTLTGISTGVTVTIPSKYSIWNVFVRCPPCVRSIVRLLGLTPRLTESSPSAGSGDSKTDSKHTSIAINLNDFLTIPPHFAARATLKPL